MKRIEMLTKENILEIHNRLTIDAASSRDPISPPGVRSEGLLESAVARQEAGFTGILKYNDALSNAASLCYGICCNHSFHNGNKRTALVALLCHLDRNGYTFTDRVNQENLYSFMVNVARHNIVSKNKLSKSHDQSDREVQAMTEWIKKRTRRIEKGERTLSYPDFEKVLRSHDVYLENHKNNYADVFKYKYEIKKRGWFGTEDVRVKQWVANIPYWPGRTVGKNLIKSVRKKAGLTDMEGVDSALFYGSQNTPDDFIQKYRKTLNKLAKT